MLIKALILENFRAYGTRTTIPMSQLTSFIGKNDAGKSSILEALDIFFEGGVSKIESADGAMNGDKRNVRIGVVFDNLPDQIILDTNAPTTLQAEHLLNEDGNLEIHKVFNCVNQSPKASIFARAMHPSAAGVDNLLQLPQKELRALVRNQELENNCNQAENPSMRQAIYNAANGLNLQLRDVPLNEENAKSIWASLQTYLPIFALFQADRPSSDQDPEVQNPMKIAIEQALQELEPALENITAEVQRRAQDTANRTLNKLKEYYPEIASTLEPKFKKPAWKNIFKLDLEADDGIPLNKRGSGVRRLVLLSFFQAEAEKRRMEAIAGNAQERRVVYAVEEPETSQHPDNQIQIISALRLLANAGDQVIITTHVPALASLIPIESLRFVDRDPITSTIRVRSGNMGDNVYGEIAETLGVLPDPLPKTGIRVSVLVEGKTDIDAIRSMIQVLVAANEIPPIDETLVFWTIGGGDSTLMDWVERRYLDKLNVPQVMIQDSDKSNAAIPVSLKKSQWLQDMAARPEVTAFLTKKRSMENYLHPAALSRITNNAVNLPANIDLDHSKMADEVSTTLIIAHQNAGQGGLNFFPAEHNGNPITGSNVSACKKIICAYVMRHMTAEEIRQRSTYVDGGAPRHEIVEWTNAIRAHL